MYLINLLCILESFTEYKMYVFPYYAMLNILFMELL